jgi:hypothetical protein
VGAGAPEPAQPGWHDSGKPWSGEGALLLPERVRKLVLPDGMVPGEMRPRFFPPRVALASMPRDEWTESSIAHSAEALVDARRLPPRSLMRFSLLPRALGPLTFARAMPWLVSEGLSARLFERLEQDGSLLMAGAPTDVFAQARASQAGESLARPLVAPAAAAGGAAGAAKAPAPPKALKAPAGAGAGSAAGGAAAEAEGEGSPTKWLAKDGRAPRFAGIVDALLDEDARIQPEHEDYTGSLDHWFALRAMDRVGRDGVGGYAPLPPLFNLLSELPEHATEGQEAGVGSRAKATTPKRATAWRVLRRNLLEVLQERFALHEMSSQQAGAIADFLLVP